MKKLLTMPAGTALLLTGCGASSSGAGTSGTDPGNITLPDLSAYGIDTAQFHLSGDTCKQQYFSDYTLYNGCAAPVDVYTAYVNDDGDTLCFDSKGRFRKFTVSGDKYKDTADRGGEKEEAAYVALTENVLRTVVPDYAAFGETQPPKRTDGQLDFPVYITAEKTYSPNCRDIAGVTAKADETILGIDVTYCDAEGADPAQFDSRLAAFTDECKAKYADWGDSIRCTADEIALKRVNGSLYGFTTVTTTASDDRSACDGVVFLAQ